MSAAELDRPRAFVVWFRDLHRWSVGSFIETGWQWPPDAICPLSTALSRKSVDVDRAKTPAAGIRLVTLHFDGEIELRDANAGESFKGRLFFADPGDVIYSKIDVRNGAIGIIPDELGQVCVSSEYPVYAVDSAVAEARYVTLLFRTDVFRRKINSMISGASGRKRVQPSDLESVDVPLPPLPVQRKIVAAWEAARSFAATTAAKIDHLKREIETLFLADLGVKAPQQARLLKAFAVHWSELERWSVMFNQFATVATDISGGTFPVANLGAVAAVSYGVQKCPANRPGRHPRPYLRVANVQRGELDLREIKYIDVPDKELASLRLEPGDLLFVEGNGSRDELGRCALWNGEIADCVHQNHILKVRPDPSQLLSAYAMTWFNTSTGKEHFFRNVKTSSGLGSINSTELRAAPIPLPSVPLQRKLADRVANQRAAITELKADAKASVDAAKADMEAMILGTKPVE